jgi:PAS domain S-box-containing protein
MQFGRRDEDSAPDGDSGRAGSAPAPSFLDGGGAVGALIRGQNWSGSPLGPPEAWPQSLRSVVGLLLGSRFPMFVAWGPELGFLYNDAYAEILGGKHPAALGARFHDIWAEIWPDILPLIEAALRGEASYRESLRLILNRRGLEEEAWFTFSYSPVRDESGAIGGMFCAVVETTDQVLLARRNTFREQLDERLRGLGSPRDVMMAAAEALGRELGVTRVGYAEVEADGEHIQVERDWTEGEAVSVAGRHRMDDFGPPIIREMRAGTIMSVEDSEIDPRTAGEAAASFAGIGCRAVLAVPLIKEGALGALFFLHHSTPRHWTEADRQLAVDVAERTWAAVGQVRAEAALRDEQARFRQLADSVPAFIWFAAPNGEVRYLNARWYDYTGQTPEQALPNGWATTLHPDDLEHTAQTWAEAREAERPYEVVMRYRRHDGAYRWFVARAEPVRGADGRVETWFGTSTDVHDRREAQAALIESEARLRALTDHLPGGMVYQIAAAPDGLRRFSYVSQSIESLLGLSAEAVLADPGIVYGAIHPDDRALLAAAEAEAIASRGPFDARVRFVRVDGEEIWCRLISAPREQADGTTVWDGLQIDITAEKRAEEALREREARLRLALDAGRMAEVMFDIPGGTLVHGGAFARLLGHASDRKLSLADLRTAYHPDDLDRVLGERRAILESDQAHYEVEHRIVRPDGEVRWIYGRGRVSRDPDGTARTVTAVYLDETERRAAEAALRKTESQLRLIADALPVLISHMGPDLRYRFVNKAYEEWFGIPHQSLIGKTVAEIVGPAAFARVEPLIRRVLAGERLAVEQSMPYQHGGTRHVHVEYVPATSFDGAPDGYYALIQDVSDARRAADELQRLAETLERRVAERTAELEQAYEQLRQSQKLEAMGQLTGGVAHDFNNLLTPIVGALDMLQRKGLGGEREQRLIGGALQSAERARTLVQRLLAFARRQPLRPIAVDVAALVEGMADLVASTSGPQIRVKVDMPPGLPPAKADPNQLEMAVLNLSVNARDAMPDGGTLTIAGSAETVGSGRKQKLPPGRYVRLSVSDTGVGMDKETLARAVEPFFSTKGIGKGTGLGLSMVHGLASQLGGALTLSSRPGLGTTAELWLPVSDRDAEGAEGRLVGAETQPPSGRVLLVDDEAMVRESTAAMLAELGYEVTEVESAEAALTLLGDGARVDLLVTDHLMPGMSGADLVRQAQALRPGLPALIITGYAEVEAIAPDLPRLAKPFRQDELAARIAALQAAG